MFQNVESAAQFVSAALRTRRYTPPVDIFSVETASPEALQEILSEKEKTGPFAFLQGTLSYWIIGLVLAVLLICLLGVIYGMMQNREHQQKSVSSI